MWEESLIASRPAEPVAQKLFSFPGAILLHGAAFGVAILASWWTIQAVNAPNIAPVYLTPEPPPIRGVFIQRHAGSTRHNATNPISQITQKNIVPLTNNQNQQQTDSGSDHGLDVIQEGPIGDPYGVPGGIDIRSFQSLRPTQKDDDPPQIIKPGMTNPVLIRRVKPEYPRLALSPRIQGIVILQAIISRNGDVEIVQVERSDHPLLEKATLEAVRQWKYRPAMLNGRPVKVYFRITVKFTLQ